MDVCFDIRKINFCGFEKPVVTLGTFDGVHLGHQAIIGRLIERSKEKKRTGVVVTYEPHPQSVVVPGDAPSLLTTLEEKLDLLEKLGVEKTVVMNFGEQLRECPAEQFVDQILVTKLKVGHLVVGADHAFGKDRTGRIGLLREAALRYNFDLEVVPALKVEGIKVSSTRIRKEMKTGEFAKATTMLGHPYPISGEITSGKGRGKSLGYPTLNLKVSSKKLLPKDGVYSVEVQLKEGYHPGMMYIGPKPTFGEEDRSVEVHLFNSEMETRKSKVKLLVQRWVREPKKFEDPTFLRDQLRSDERKIKEMFKMDY